MDDNPSLEHVVKQLAEALAEAKEHLEYCGYGNKWEREIARESKLQEKIKEALLGYVILKLRISRGKWKYVETLSSSEEHRGK